MEMHKNTASNIVLPVKVIPNESDNHLPIPISIQRFHVADSRLGSGCGAVGRAVASDTRGPVFESSRRQLFLNIFIVNCLYKRFRMFGVIFSLAT